MATDDFEDSNLMSDIVLTTIYGFIVGALIVGAFFVLTALRGRTEENYLLQYMLYSVPLVTYLVFLILVKVVRRTANGPKMNSLTAFLHDPERSVFRSFKDNAIINVFTNPLKLLFFSLILFSLMGVISAVTQSVTGSPGFGNAVFPLAVGQIGQQVTAQGNVFFSVYAAFSENAWLYILLSVLVTGELLLFTMIGVPKFWGYLSLLIPNSILGAIIWLKIHILVSGVDAVQNISHFIFGFNASLFTLLTASIIPADSYHVINNLFRSIAENFSNAYVPIAFALILLVSILGFALMFFIKRRR